MIICQAVEKQHDEADDAVDDEEDGLGGGHILVAGDGEAGDGDSLADDSGAPEHELGRRVDLAGRDR